MSRRPGIALVFAILALVLIEAMTVGVIAMSQHARAAADMHGRAARAQLADEQLVNAVMRGWETSGYDSLPVGTTTVVSGLEIERLTEASYLIKGRRAAAVARLLDRPRAIEEATNANVVIDTALAIGGLRWSELDSIADEHIGGVVSFSDTIPGRFPLRLARKDVAISGGVGRGILIVDGSLVMQSGIFVGYVVVRGTLTMFGDAHIFGSVRTRADGLLVPGPSITPWADSVMHVIMNTPSAHRLILQQRLYIPAF